MKDNPYIGPRPFERVDRINFHGRARETRDLLSLIMAERVVLFYAQSGAGKTSLLNTQIIPALEDDGFFVLPVVRVGSDLPPGLPAKLVKNIYVFSVWMGLTGKETPLATLTGTSLNAALNMWLLDSPLDDQTGELRPPILILDQFEEILTTHRDRWQDARGFFEQLAEALERNPKLGVVLAMREDHVAGLDPYAPLLPKRLKTRFRMEQLKVEGALEAVKRPAAYAGHPFESGVAEKLVDDLRRMRTMQAEGEQIAEADVLGQYVEPVQLQVVCHRLWDNLPDRPADSKITAEDVEQFGNVDRALTDFYENALRQTLEQAVPLSQAQGWKVREGQLRRWFGQQLITPMQTRGLVMRGSTTTGDLPNPVVDLLEARHLIRADVRAGARWYEIAHDRLVEPILRSNVEWEQTGQSPLHRAARRWLDAGKNPDFLYRGDALKKGQEFAEEHRDACEPIDLEFLAESQKAQAAIEKERRQHFLIRRLAVAALIALVLAMVAGAFAYRERDRANEQADIAEMQAVIADQQRAKAEDSQAQAEASQKEAETQRNEAYTQRAEAERQRAEAERLARLAIVRQLISQASEFVGRFPQRSLLLALEALRINANTDTILARAAEDELRQILVQAGGRVLKNYGRRLSQVAFSAGSPWLLSASEDGQVDLWDFSADSPAPPRQLLRASATPSRAVAVSPSGRWAAAGDASGQVYLWDLTIAEAAPLLLDKHFRAVRALEFSPNEEWLISGSADGTVHVWDIAGPDVVPQPAAALNAHQGNVNAVAVDPDSALLATGGADNLIKLYSLDDLTTAPLTLTGHTDQVFTLAFDPLGQYLASGSIDATARLWDLTEDDINGTVRVLPGHEEQVYKVAFSPDGHWLATGSVDTTTRLWNMELENPEESPLELRGHNDQVWSLAYTPDSRWLFTGSRDGIVQAWDLFAPDPTIESAHHVLRGHEGPIQTMSTSYDGHWLATGGDDVTLQLWGVNTPGSPAAPTVLRGHSSVVRGALLDSTLRTLATFGGDGDVRLWDMTAQEPAARSSILPSHDQSIYAAAFSPDGRWLATASQDNTSRLWDLRPPDGIITSTVLRGHTSALRALAFTPNNRWLITGSRDGTARIWDITQPDPAQDAIVLRGHNDQIRVLDLSSDGRWLATGGDDRRPRLWDLRAADIISSALVFPDHGGAVRALDFSPDNRWLATGGDDSVVRVWNLRATDPTTSSLSLRGHAGTVRAIRFSPDGRWLATAADEGNIMLWDAAQLAASAGQPEANPKPSFQLYDHEGSVRAIDISPDSRWLLSGSEDGDARLWDLTAENPSAYSLVFPGHNGPVWGVSISPDGRQFFTASQDGNARIWTPVPLDNVLQIACSTAGRNLSAEEWTYYVGGDAAADYHRTCEQFPAGAGVK
jgi:WD40 repeat protein